MCGIAGAIDLDPGRAGQRVGMINDAQRHRGPDDMVTVQVGGFTLGNTRLAIQDPGPAGNQPFVSRDRRYHCVFNGEIYNHRRLVERYGLQVRTSCDGEIIPELWSKLGADALAELRGMFAIALVDSLEERLFLARDPFGIKPLYWCQVPGGMVFASEVRPLVHAAGQSRLDSAAIARYLQLGAVAADQSPFADISAVAPNSVASFGRDGRAAVRQIQPGGPLEVRRAPAGLAAELTESIDLHLNADVPTALLLSAGIDSATIAAVGRGLGRDLNCITVATGGAADESEAAARTARHYGHQHRRQEAVLEDGDVPGFFAAMQRPSIDGLNTYIVAKAVREAGFKVALSGLGGDEALGGYSHYRLLRYLPMLRALDKVPGQLGGAAATALALTGVAGQQKLARLLRTGGPRDGWGLSMLQREVLPAALASRLAGTGPPPEAAPAGELRAPRRHGPFGAMVSAEVALYLQATLLPDADCFAMASSVELRLPFVDSRVFAASLELAAGRASQTGKKAVGTALGDPYLSSLAAQPKRGFAMPMRRWMDGPLAPVLAAASEPDAPVWSVLSWQVAQAAGLLPLRPGKRWANAWSIAALNSWLGSVSVGFPTAR